MGALPDEHFDYIIDHCLSVTKRREENGAWAAVSAPAPNGGRSLMYRDIDLVTIGVIVFNVLRRNLSGFFGAVPSDFKEQIQGKISSMFQ
jgi:hypothetical protein